MAHSRAVIESQRNKKEKKKTTLKNFIINFKDNHCLRIKLLGDCYYCISMFDSQSWKSRPDHAVCSVETGLHMIKAIKDVRHNTHVSHITEQHI